jgi:general secretion pathway protein C
MQLVKTSILLLAVAFAGTARADSYSAVTIERGALDSIFRELTSSNEEPAGLVARSDFPELGLKAGDVVRAIDGRPALGQSGMHSSFGPVTYLDVQHGKQKLVIRAAVKVTTAEQHMKSEDYAERIDQLRKMSTISFGGGFVQLTKNNAASGVAMPSLYWSDFGLEEGDVIRAIDGAPINTVEALFNALDKAKSHPKLEIKFERADQTFTMKFVLEGTNDPALEEALQRIKKTSDSSYEIPADVLDMILADPMQVAKGARIIPAMKSGKNTGFKLYAIRPNSMWATLGLMNGDTLEKINGTELDSVETVLDVYTKFRDAKKLVVGIERRGKPLELTYMIKR